MEDFKTIENITLEMTVELLYYLVNGEPELTTGVAMSILVKYDQEIRFAALEMYNDYEKEGNIEELNNAPSEFYRGYLIEIYSKLDKDVNQEMYKKVRKIAVEMYQEYARKYGFPTNSNSEVKREFFNNVEYAITGHKLEGKFVDEKRLVDGFIFNLENLRYAQKVLPWEEFNRPHKNIYQK
jgi:hypothetical protein